MNTSKFHVDDLVNYRENGAYNSAIIKNVNVLLNKYHYTIQLMTGEVIKNVLQNDLFPLHITIKCKNEWKVFLNEKFGNFLEIKDNSLGSQAIANAFGKKLELGEYFDNFNFGYVNSENLFI